MSGINIKELCKQLRADGKHGAVLWTREESKHYLSNRHYAVRFNELPKEVLITLFSIFCKVAEVGETLFSQGGFVVEQPKPVDFSKFYCPEKANINGEKTPYIRDFGDKKFAAVIKFPNRVSFVDEKYMKLAADVKELKGTDSAFTPLYLADDDLMVLPYRTTDNPNFIIDLIETEQPA